MTPNVYLNQSQIEREFGLSRNKLAQLRAKGVGPRCVGSGRRTLYSRHDLEAIFGEASNTQEAR
ncbi:hypothetical protein [Brevundimonas sp.]|uniref:hypothetical protein n=1 Tax=Brevundimonas sp. TaxID=1871086 RepID=UPI0025EC0276|nr:hypothetical protein [Brevundimonas sp.]